MNKITIKEFQDLCLSINIPYPKIEADSYFFRRNRNGYVLTKIEDRWKSFEELEPSEQFEKILSDTKELSKLIEETGIEIEYLVHSACLLFDNILNLINKTVLVLFNNDVVSKKVRIEEIKKQLNKKKESQRIITLLAEIENSDSFKYFHDFDIISKHRGTMIKENFSLKLQEYEMNSNLNILDFEIDGRKYEAITCFQLLDLYKDFYLKIHKLFCSICECLSDSIK